MFTGAGFGVCVVPGSGRSQVAFEKQTPVQPGSSAGHRTYVEGVLMNKWNSSYTYLILFNSCSVFRQFIFSFLFMTLTVVVPQFSAKRSGILLTRCNVYKQPIRLNPRYTVSYGHKVIVINLVIPLNTMFPKHET